MDEEKNMALELSVSRIGTLNCIWMMMEQFLACILRIKYNMNMNHTDIYLLFIDGDGGENS